MKSIKVVFFVFVYLTMPTLTIQNMCLCSTFPFRFSKYCKEFCKEERRMPNIGEVIFRGRIPKSYSSDTLNPSNSDVDAISSQSKIYGTMVPTYALWLIGIIMFLLTAIAIILGVLLYRTKLRGYQIFNSPPITKPDNTLNANSVRRYVTQSSQDMSLLNLNTNQEDRKSDAASKNGEPNRISDSSPPPANPMKIYKSVRKPVEHHVILKEQMRKICEDALAKTQNSGLTASLKDLNKLLNDDDAEKRKTKPEDNNIAKEKSASYPQLDIYDEAPRRNVPVTNLDDDDDIPLYDNLPAPYNKVVRDSTTNYVMPITLDRHAEPSYINARSIFP